MTLRTLQIAWRNMGRNKKRTGLALLAIAVGQFALLAMSGLMRGYVDNIHKAITGPMIGHAQVHDPNWREERALDLVIEDVNSRVTVIRQDSDVANAGARIYAPALVAPEQDAFMAMVVGLDVQVESQPYGILSGFSDALSTGKVLIGHMLAKKTQAEIGQEIAIVGQAADGSLANDLYIVQDIIKCPVDLINQNGIVMTLDDAQTLMVMPDQAHEIVIRAQVSEDSRALAARLATHPVLQSLEVLAWEELVPEFLVILKSADWVGYFVLILVFIAAVAGIANTLMMSVFERLHELGMLLALGCRPFRIVRMILWEAILLALIGACVGTILGYGFVGATAKEGIDMASWAKGDEAENIAYQGLNLPLHVFPRLELFDTWLGFTAVVLTSLVASIWPAWIAARLEPVEAMRA